ncbi:MAG: hypothetical protein FWE61_05590 [Micrococcales bacterium]|nr:hypothetical protein [Micrococcales bacterium]
MLLVVVATAVTFAAGSVFRIAYLSPQRVPRPRESRLRAFRNGLRRRRRVRPVDVTLAELIASQQVVDVTAFAAFDLLRQHALVQAGQVSAALTEVHAGASPFPETLFAEPELSRSVFADELYAEPEPGGPSVAEVLSTEPDMSAPLFAQELFCAGKRPEPLFDEVVPPELETSLALLGNADAAETEQPSRASGEAWSAGLAAPCQLFDEALSADPEPALSLFQQALFTGPEPPPFPEELVFGPLPAPLYGESAAGAVFGDWDEDEPFFTPSADQGTLFPNPVPASGPPHLARGDDEVPEAAPTPEPVPEPAACAEPQPPQDLVGAQPAEPTPAEPAPAEPAPART